LLRDEPDLEVVGEAGSLEEASLAAALAEVALVDWDQARDLGSRFLPGARQAGFRGRVLVIAGGEISESDAVALVAQGAAGILLRHHRAAGLCAAIRAVRAGETWLEQRFVQALMKAAVSPHRTGLRTTLSGRETQTLQAVVEGLANKEIAGRLAVSESAVKAILQQLFHKTGVRSRSQLVRVALEQYRDAVVTQAFLPVGK